MHGMLGVGSPFLGGVALFVLAASGGLAVLALRHREPRSMMLFGACTLAVGVCVAVWSLPHHAIAGFFAGTSIAGVGFGTGFQGAVRSIVSVAAPHERAGVLSIVFIVCYLSMGLPAIGAGALVAWYDDISGTAEQFGAAVIVLTMIAVLTAPSRTKAGHDPKAGP
jgi:MFS family permease